MKFIAELCQNHNGNFDTLLRMVDAAAESGASHIKIQHIYARNLVYRPEFEQGLERDGQVFAIKRPWQLEYERLKRLELSEKECTQFVEYVEAIGLVPMTTCFTRGDVEQIAQQGFRNVKVASYDCASAPMLRELATRFEHIYVSTGATFDDEVRHAAHVLRQHSKAYSLLHCVTQYPTPLEVMHLNRIAWLQQFAGEVGFSDHSLVSRDGVVAAKAAIACGADVIERHFTISDPSETKDGPVSISADDVRVLVDFSKLSRVDQFTHLTEVHPGWEQMLGQAERWLSDAELLNRDYYRGRFATPRRTGAHRLAEMVLNWEETPL
ncbi:general stress protein [Rhodobacterales bacterium HKCCA1058]|nr:general stress protein [Rhodobacterales bacterium HKCCA1058]